MKFEFIDIVPFLVLVAWTAIPFAVGVFVGQSFKFIKK